MVAGPRRAVAWRVLDAQYFGLAQRRERVFVVAGALDGPDPAAILLESEGVPGNPAPRRSPGENVAPTLARGSPGGRVYGLDADTVESLQAEIAPCLRGQPNCSYRADTEAFIPLAYGGNNSSGPLEVSPALNAHGGPVGRLDFESEAFICATLDASYGRLQGCSGQDAGHGHSHLLPVGFDCKASGQNGFGVGEIASTMRAMGHVGGHADGGGHLAVMAPVSVAMRGRDGGNQIEMGDDVAYALRASQGGSDKPHVLASAVRRLMPVECERLQGFPDFHTDVPNGNRPAADGPRYKALGNSMPVPVLRWLLRRTENEIRTRRGRA